MVFYLLRRRRLCYDIPSLLWSHFVETGSICLLGYLFNFLPYFLIDRPMFLHNYLPALIFKILLLCVVIEHLYSVFEYLQLQRILFAYKVVLVAWLASILLVFYKFSMLSYGNRIGQSVSPVTATNILDLQWKNTWDFILHNES